MIRKIVVLIIVLLIVDHIEKIKSIDVTNTNENVRDETYELVRVVATSEEFQNVIHADISGMVLFTMPTCRRSDMARQEMKMVARSFRSMKDRVRFLEVNIQASRDLARELKVTGFPTMLWFLRGTRSPDTYVGPREAASILAFVNERLDTRRRLVASSPSVSSVLKLHRQTFDTIVSNERVAVLVVFYNPNKARWAEVSSEVEMVASRYVGIEDVTIAKADMTKMIDIASLCSVNPRNDDVAVRWFSFGADKSVREYDGALSMSALVRFIDETLMPSSTSPHVVESKDLLETWVSDLCEQRTDRFDEKAETLSRLLSLRVRHDAPEALRIATYQKIGQRIARDGFAYVRNELRRLRGLLTPSTRRHFSSKKRRHFEIRLDVLTVIDEYVTSNDCMGRRRSGNIVPHSASMKPPDEDEL